MEMMHLLITLDSNYLPHVRPLLQSIYVNNPGESFCLHLIHDEIADNALRELGRFCASLNVALLPHRLGNGAFSEAPVTAYYSKAMYYRLLASKILPPQLDRILYLDPDTLAINSLRPLYDTGLGNKLFAAAAHTGLTSITKHINRLRLGTPDAENYFNSGVLLLNLKEQRARLSEREIFAYVRAKGEELILPDQDVLNALYGQEILPLDDSLYNYDARRYETYFLTSNGEKDLDWVMANTVILHYCGREKPWQKSTRGRFASLYKHYAHMARMQGECAGRPAIG